MHMLFININNQIKTKQELDAEVENLTLLIHEAAVVSTPSTLSSQRHTTSTFQISAKLRSLLQNKRKLGRVWQNTRNPIDKRNFNKATKALRDLIFEEKNKLVGDYLKSLDVCKTAEHNLWNATKYLKRPSKHKPLFKDSQRNWCRTENEHATAFENKLADTFKPYEFTSDQHSHVLNSYLDCACQMDLPIKRISVYEVEEQIKNLKNVKSPGHDNINAIATKLLPNSAVVHLTKLFKSILCLDHFPSQWKCAEIIMIPKPGKPKTCIGSVRPISLLVTFSKIFERILLRNLLPILEKQAIFPIKQAFDKIWHTGMLYKIKKFLPAPYFHLLKSYLLGRKLYVKVGHIKSSIYNINAGIPQGSVLGPVLYTMYTADMPVGNNIVIATYADDTAILSSD